MNNFKEGDLITAYKKGYHEVVAIRKRWENKSGTTEYERFAYCIWDTFDASTCGNPMNDLVGYKMKYRADGTPVNGKSVHWCDESFCRHIKDALDLKVKEMEATLKKLKQLV